MLSKPMLMIRNRILLTLSFIVLVCSGAFWLADGPAASVENLPKQISDEAFWQMITEFSEPGGTFPYDNFVSNETTFQFVIPQLKKNVKGDGVYLGVGPEQNFTYIAAVQPRIAFIVDIRRQNMIEHLMHKALFEVSANRVEYLSRLFSRKRPANVDARSDAEALFRAYANVVPDRELFEENLEMIKERLIRHHGFKFSDDDEKGIELLYNAFHTAGPNLTYYGFKLPIPRLSMPTYEDLMTQTDEQGLNWSYMANEDNFQRVKGLQEKNLVVPIVGDFAGSKALRAVGQYVKDHGSSVTTVYASNVEQYLFQQNDNWKKYYTSLSLLPIDSFSTFIRSVYRLAPDCPKCVTVTMLSPIAELVDAFKADRITGYNDVIQMSK